MQTRLLSASALLAAIQFVNAQPSTSDNPQRYDPYAPLVEKAKVKDVEWRAQDLHLEAAIKPNPCAPTAIEAIRKSKDLKLTALLAKGQYYQKWMDYLQGNDRTIDRIRADHVPIRAETEKDLQRIRETVDAVKQRKSNLVQGGVTDLGPARLLDKQLGELSQRLDIAQTGLYHSDQILKSTTDARAANKAEETALQEMKDALGTESLSWQNYYDAREARRFLACVQISHVEKFPPDGPPKK